MRKIKRYSIYRAQMDLYVLRNAKAIWLTPCHMIVFCDTEDASSDWTEISEVELHGLDPDWAYHAKGNDQQSARTGR